MSELAVIIFLILLKELNVTKKRCQFLCSHIYPTTKQNVGKTSAIPNFHCDKRQNINLNVNEISS